MDIISAGYVWLMVALLLALAELVTGSMVLLALAIAVLLTAGVAALGAPLVWQLAALGMASAVCVPLMIKVIRPWFSPAGVNYGVAGTGAQQGQRFYIVHRDYDGASGIKIKGDFFRAEYVDAAPDDAPAEGEKVVLDHFDGTLARVIKQGNSS
ncbi:nodulation efficiency, NfeD-like protein [Vreelandella subglaciescola]|uniref:Membrane protein implicated in regulation of membrane protease activity n=1 Tax=Vreelandella subglaciescola TaxID=29571 RepID=A0A1M7HZB8_9GAMM|nr:nodulation efficiency, NfeD-like protein [Halomonas subglaciescola]SHM33891.1 Membrane protein implicated in regulation of membrane protease activity [Halomonas subglaciescola]